MTEGVRETHEVPAGTHERLDVVACQLFACFPSRSSVRKASRRKLVRVDGEVVRGNPHGREGQVIERLADRKGPAIRLSVPVVWEDDCMAITVKPPGLRVNGAQLRTLEHALPHVLKPCPLADALTDARPVHRLDAKTGGLVCVAKSAGALVQLSRSFQERRVSKRYAAIVLGRVEGEGEVREPIDGRAAHTRYRSVSVSRALRTEHLSLLDLTPVTGRRHQLRRHMAGLGHPVLGDIPYGKPGTTLLGKGLFLFAYRLELPHPARDERVVVEVAVPPKFGTFLAREQRRWERHRS